MSVGACKAVEWVESESECCGGGVVVVAGSYEIMVKARW